MDSALGVTVDDSREQLFHDLGCPRFREHACSDYFLEQFPSSTELGDKIVVAEVLSELVESHDIRVLLPPYCLSYQFLQHLYLVHDVPAVRIAILADDLHGVDLSVALVFDFPDFSKGAFAEDRDDLVAARNSTDVFHDQIARVKGN